MSPDKIVALCNAVSTTTDPSATAQEIYTAQLYYCRQNAQKPEMLNLWIQIEQALATLRSRATQTQRKDVQKVSESLADLKRSVANSTRSSGSFSCKLALVSSTKCKTVG